MLHERLEASPGTESTNSICGDASSETCSSEAAQGQMDTSDALHGLCAEDDAAASEGCAPEEDKEDEAPDPLVAVSASVPGQGSVPAAVCKAEAPKVQAGTLTLSRGVCPNCPGPHVPHHCRMASSFGDELMALQMSLQGRNRRNPFLSTGRTASGVPATRAGERRAGQAGEQSAGLRSGGAEGRGSGAARNAASATACLATAPLLKQASSKAVPKMVAPPTIAAAVPAAPFVVPKRLSDFGVGVDFGAGVAKAAPVAASAVALAARVPALALAAVALAAHEEDEKHKDGADEQGAGDKGDAGAEVDEQDEAEEEADEEQEEELVADEDEEAAAPAAAPSAVPAAAPEEVATAVAQTAFPPLPVKALRSTAPARSVVCHLCKQRPAAAASCQKCGGKGSLECSRCGGSGRFAPPCRACGGAGVTQHFKFKCNVCQGKGCVDRGECNGCHGGKRRQCFGCQGSGAPPCAECASQQEEDRKNEMQRKQGPPPPGVSISQCAPGELSNLADLWSERGGRGQVVEAWIVDNPLLSYHYHERRSELKNELRREPDELQGFHGTHPTNVLSIAQSGFDSSRRAGQVYGAGEYFAKDPSVSVGYCRGGEYMFVCRLCLGHASSSQSNLDGDHIWVPSTQYYVISQPDQILPQYIVRFSQYGSSSRSSSIYDYNQVSCRELTDALSQPRWTTKRERQVRHVPPNRPCAMSMPSTNALWMGYLHAYLDDHRLEADVRAFFERHAADFVMGMRVHIASGKYKKAHVQFTKALPKALVHRLNTLPFMEGGAQRTICVDDAHGSPGQPCPRWIAGYCRGRNLRYTHTCWCSHKARPTEQAHYRLVDVDLRGAKGTEIVEKFMKSAPFHDCATPKVVALHAVQNDDLAQLHEEYRAYLRNKNKEEPTVRELYHGTNNKILDVLFKHGLQPPSDFSAADSCPVSGGKGLCTSLCNNDCKHCVERHEWDRCHMFGLGIYLADMAQKSHRYCSQPEIVPGTGKRRFRMVVCSVLGRALEVAGHLKVKDAMHDVPNVRSLGTELAEMIEPHQCRVPDKEAVESADILFLKGLGCNCRPGFSVVNSEFIAYHPYQCLPKYQITYEV